MRFSKKQFPVLGHLDTHKKLLLHQEIGLTQSILKLGDSSDRIKSISSHCEFVLEGDSIDFVSVPFFEKIMSEKIFEKLTSIFTELNDCQGILLYPNTRFSKIRATSYMIFERQPEEPLIAEIHLYHDDGRVVVLYVKIEGDTINWTGITSESITNASGQPFPEEQKQQWIINHIQTLFSVLTFKQFAEVEVTQIGGKDYPRKVKINNEKYLNEVSHKVNVLDSRWFTKTIRTDGFAVTGHFRLQPYGSGMTKRKLIYIEDFMKTGYTRGARIKQSVEN